MKEIGGYIELDTNHGKEYHDKAIAVNSGRHALEYIIIAKNIRKIYIPYFLCDSIRKMCKKCRCEYEFYNIDINFRPQQTKIKENEYIYIVNYYGQLRKNDIIQYVQQFRNVILDNAQAFFDYPVLNVDTIYTCRKFFGVADGGYVYTNKQITEELPIDISYERIHYILGRYEEGAEKHFLESTENNNAFENQPLKSMSKLTKNIMSGLDYEYIKKRRTENFAYLDKCFKDVNKLKLTIPKGAFMYPLYTDNGSDMRKYLIKNKIFVPTLWEDVFKDADERMIEYDLAKNIVPIPIDQRYDINDMKYIVNEVKKWHI